MKYSIIINPLQKNSGAELFAFHFIQALIQAEHEISNVFFYGYAVKQAFFNELDWNKVSKHGIKLIACSTIADNYLEKKLIVNPEFDLEGLGSYVNAILDSPKHVEFV